MAGADSLLKYLDSELGRYSDEGQLHRLNTVHFITTDTELAGLFLKSDTIVRLTGNSFDPTLGALSQLWGFPEPVSVPDSASIRLAMTGTGWSSCVEFSEDTIKTAERTQMDFGAIAKGYAVDRTYRFLIESGAVECLVEVGGEVRCGSTTGRVWNIGVRHPRRELLSGKLVITEGAVATSGDYECYFVQDGVRYSHLLDSRTGYPSRNAAGATVIAPDCTTADAVATAAAVAGPARAQNFSPDLYSGMIIITQEENGDCTTFEYGDIPWSE